MEGLNEWLDFLEDLTQTLCWNGDDDCSVLIEDFMREICRCLDVLRENDLTDNLISQ